MSSVDALLQAEKAWAEISVLLQAIAAAVEVVERTLIDFRAPPLATEPSCLAEIADEFDRSYAIAVGIGRMVDRLCTSSRAELERALVRASSTGPVASVWAAKAVEALDRLARAKDLVAHINSRAAADAQLLRGAAMHGKCRRDAQTEVDGLMRRLGVARRSEP